jgi:hypothetical protein
MSFGLLNHYQYEVISSFGGAFPHGRFCRIQVSRMESPRNGIWDTVTEILAWYYFA